MPVIGTRVLVYLRFRDAVRRENSVPGVVTRDDPGPPHATRIALEDGREVKAGKVWYCVEANDGRDEP